MISLSTIVMLVILKRIDHTEYKVRIYLVNTI